MPADEMLMDSSGLHALLQLFKIIRSLANRDFKLILIFRPEHYLEQLNIKFSRIICFCHQNTSPRTLANIF